MVHAPRRDSLDAAGFESACSHERVHADAGHGAAVDVYGIDAARGHDFVDLFENALEGNAFWRIDLDADGEFAGLEFFPKTAFRLAVLDRRRPCRKGVDGGSDGARLCWPERLHRFCHGADVGRRRAAAAAEDAHTERSGFSREESEIFRRGLWIDDAVAFAPGETCVGHATDAEIIDDSELLKNGEQSLRAKRAVGANDLNVFVFQLGGGISGAKVAVRGAFFGVSEFRDDGQAREGTDGVNREQNLLDVGKRFEDKEIDAALFEGERLLVKNIEDLVGRWMAGLHAEAEGTDGAGDENFACGRFARFAGDFDAAAVEALDFVSEAEGSELEAVGAECIGLDDLCAGFDVGLVDAEDGFRLGGVELVETALRADSFVEQRAHRTIGDEDRIFQALIEIENFQVYLILSGTVFTRKSHSTLLFHEAGDGAHQIVLGKDFKARVAHLNKHSRIFMAEDVRDALDG